MLGDGGLLLGREGSPAGLDVLELNSGGGGRGGSAAALGDADGGAGESADHGRLCVCEDVVGVRNDPMLAGVC